MNEHLAISGAEIELRPRKSLAQRPAETELDECLRVLSIRRRLITAILGVCLSIAFAISLLMTPKYEAISRVEVNHRPIGGLGMSEDQLGLDDSIDSNLALHTQIEELGGDSIALRVIKEMELFRNPEYQRRWWAIWDATEKKEAGQPLEAAPATRERCLKTFHRNLTVKLIPGTRLIEVKYRDREAKLAADVDNAIVNTFLDQYYRTRLQANRQASEWLSSQLDSLKSDVETSQKRVVEFQRQAGILGTDETHNIVTSKLEDLNRKVADAEASRILHGAIYRVAQTYDPDLVIGMEVKSGYSTDDRGEGVLLLRSLRSRQLALREERAAALAKFGPAYPKIAQLDSSLQELDSQVSAEMQRTVSHAEAEYQAGKDAEASLKAEFEQQKQEANRLNDSAVQYTILKQEMESQRGLYEEMSRKLLESGVIAGIRASNLIVMDPALPPARTAKPSWGLNLGLGLAAGLFFGVVGAFVREFTDTRVHSPLEVEFLTGSNSLGVIPDLRCRAVTGGLLVRRSLSQPFVQTPTLSAPKSAMAEIFRSIGSCLLLSRKEGPPKTIMVTSPLPGEGKSTVAVNLAVVLAQRGNNVLLIDADMRRGTVHAFLNLRQSSGLSEVLEGSATDPELIVQRGIANLSVLSSGRVPQFPAELIGSDRFDENLQYWEQKYDFVVLDAPPILSVTDPILLAPKVQSILLVTRHARTSKSSLVRAVEMLQKINVMPSGAVLNGVDVDSPAYEQYFGYEFRATYGKYYPQKVAQS